MGHLIVYPSHEFFTTGITYTTIIILFFYLNKNLKEKNMFSNFVKATSNYSKMPFIFRIEAENYGINSAQTNQIMTTACIIVS